MNATSLVPATTPRLSTPKPTAFAAGEKKKKNIQQPLVRQSLWKIQTKKRQKGIMDKKKQPMEPQDLDEEEMNVGVEDINTEGTKPISWLLLYIPP